MQSYFEYLRLLLTNFFEHLVKFLYKGVVSPWEDVPGNFQYYHSLLTQHMGGFKFGGWFFFILFLIFFIALLGAIGFGLFILIRKYVRFVKRELDKDELRKQVERLNYELYLAVNEKNKILNLKIRF